MGILSQIKKVIRQAPPLNETDFKAWAAQATEKEISAYIETLPPGSEYDYTRQGWGHAINTHCTYGIFIHYVSGFYGRWPQPCPGSILLAKTESGKIGRYIVLNIEWKRDPHDMFYAYIVCLGYKE